MSSSQNIYLFRHGELPNSYLNKYVGHLDVPLSEVGQKQMERINFLIRELGNTNVFSSDLKRTYTKLDAPVKIKAFREINFGKWEGLSWDEIEKLYPEGAAEYLKFPDDFCFPGGESFGQLIERVIPAFDNALNENNKDVVFVVHAGVIRAIISDKLGFSFEELFSIKIDYGKCTIIRKESGRFFLSSLNVKI